MEMAYDILNLKSEKEFYDLCDELRIDLKLSSGKTAEFATFNKLVEYLTAFASLYGLVPIETAIELINGYENEEFTAQDIIQFEKLYSRIDAYFCLADDYILYNEMLDAPAVDYIEMLKRSQGGKPYAVLPKDIVLRYAEEGYFEVPPQYGELFHFLTDSLNLDVMEADEITDEIYFIYRINGDHNSVFEYLKKHKVDFEEEDQLKKFTLIIDELKNNTRTCENCGNTPNELQKYFSEHNQ